MPTHSCTAIAPPIISIPPKNPSSQHTRIDENAPLQLRWLIDFADVARSVVGQMGGAITLQVADAIAVEKGGAINRGERKSHVSQMFNISWDRLDCWLQRRETTGSVKAAQGYQQGHSHRVKDWQAFRAFAQTQGDRTQAEMA